MAKTWDQVGPGRTIKVDLGGDQTFDDWVGWVVLEASAIGVYIAPVPFAGEVVSLSPSIFWGDTPYLGPSIYPAELTAAGEAVLARLERGVA